MERHLFHLSLAEIQTFETTKEVVHAAVEAGANLIELGIPFSDPTAEGCNNPGG